jgi:hypothetical protein
MLGTAAIMVRDNVQIAGSSTVLPYATIVAEAFGENFDFPTPVVESGGSSPVSPLLRRRGRKHHRHRQRLAFDPRLARSSLRRQRRDRHHRGPHRL